VNILICSFSFPPQSGGVSHVAYVQARGLVERGHRVTVATAYDPAREDLPLPEGLKVVPFRVSGNAHPRSRYRGDIGAYLDFIGSFRGDVICCHCWQIWTTDLAVRAFHRTRARKVLVSHGVSANSHTGWPRTLPSWLLWRPYVCREMPRILKAFDHLVLLSGRCDRDRFYDHWMARRSGYQAISIIPNGVDLRAHQGAPSDFRDRFGIRTPRMVLLVGAYYDLKNHRLALEAFVSARPEHTTLVFIGQERNAYSEGLEMRWRSAQKALPSCHMICLDRLAREDILAAYKAADLYLCASRTEYFPLTILDAMASAMPFISTDVGCVGDLPGGRVVRSQGEMARAIRDLLGDEPGRKALGVAGRTACESTYNWPSVIDAYETLFERLLKNGG
jgi:glycosyltransferase involved in cell wall biosynthesis